VCCVAPLTWPLISRAAHNNKSFWEAEWDVLCRRKHKRRAKYELLHTERTLLTSDEAFNCIKMRDDDEGLQCVFLNKKDVISAAADSIKTTLAKMGPMILPVSELVGCPIPACFWPHGTVHTMPLSAALHIALHCSLASIRQLLVQKLTEAPNTQNG
jgi:3-ketoacyl-CoA synthase